MLQAQSLPRERLFDMTSSCSRAAIRVRVYANRGPYACIYPHDTIAPRPPALPDFPKMFKTPSYREGSVLDSRPIRRCRDRRGPGRCQCLLIIIGATPEGRKELVLRARS